MNHHYEGKMAEEEGDIYLFALCRSSVLFLRHGLLLEALGYSALCRADFEVQASGAVERKCPSTPPPAFVGRAAVPGRHADLEPTCRGEGWSLCLRLGIVSFDRKWISSDITTVSKELLVASGPFVTVCLLVL